MPIFTPTPTASGGGSLAYDSVTYTVTDSGSGYATVSVQLTNAGDNIATTAAIWIMLVRGDSLARWLASTGELMLSDNDLSENPWWVDSEGLFLVQSDNAGVLDATIENATFGALDGRLLIVLPGGGLALSDVITVLGVFEP